MFYVPNTLFDLCVGMLAAYDIKVYCVEWVATLVPVAMHDATHLCKNDKLVTSHISSVNV